MVVVHIGIAAADHIDVKVAVPGKEREHVVEKAAAGVAAADAGAVEAERQGDVGLGGPAGN